MSQTRSRRDLYEEVTNAVIEALEAGTIPWHQPWKAPSDMPTSLSTGRSYRGVNAFLLTMKTSAKCYCSKWWGTYKQISERGGQVRKGEKATTVVFWKFLEREDEETGKRKSIPMLRGFSVFNVDQCDTENMKLPTEPEPSYVEPVVLAEKIAAGYLADGPTFKPGGDRAYFSPSEDVVRVPEPCYFKSQDAYYSTLFHELTHSTGHKSRLARPDLLAAHHFGDPSYSREELVAEMGAAMVCAIAGIEQVTVPQSAAYVQSWLKVLRADKRAVVVAAGQAQKAADMIAGTDDDK